MAPLSAIKASNAHITDTNTPVRVVVFAGGTSGIGKYTLRALVATGTSLRIYLIGRPSSSGSAQSFISELAAINSRAEIIWTEGQISLMSDTSRLCSLVASKESLLDLLFMTAGFAPFGPRRETSEGIEVAAALEYYSRVLFMLHLLPLLRKSKGRVISVGGGGKEWKNSIFLDNLDLKKPENFKFWTVQRMYLGMTTVAMETLADQKENQGVTFIHSWPGIVSTGNVRRGLYEDETSWWAWFVHWVFEPFLTMIGFSEEECGERYLYQCVSARYGGKGVPWMGQKGVDSWEREGDEIEGQGGRLFLVDRKCECTPNAGVMKTLRGETKERVWDHTLKVLGPYL